MVRCRPIPYQHRGYLMRILNIILSQFTCDNLYFLFQGYRLLGWQPPASLLFFLLYRWQSETNILHAAWKLSLAQHNLPFGDGAREITDIPRQEPVGIAHSDFQLWKWVQHHKVSAKTDEGSRTVVKWAVESRVPLSRLIYGTASHVYFWLFSLHTLWGEGLYHVQELQIQVQFVASEHFYTKNYDSGTGFHSEPGWNSSTHYLT